MICSGVVLEIFIIHELGIPLNQPVTESFEAYSIREDLYLLGYFYTQWQLTFMNAIKFLWYDIHPHKLGLVTGP